MNLLLSLLASAAIGQAPSPGAPRLFMYPDVHGDTVVFSFAGDIWSANLHGGEARRLTSGFGDKRYESISPDGRWIAFSATYDGAIAVYVIPIEGGEPKRLTYDSAPDTVLGWTPDGRIAYCTAGTSPYLGRQQELYTVSPTGGMPASTPIKEIRWGKYFDGGSELAYTRVPSFLYNWRRYRGGTQGVVSLFNFASNSYSELPHGREQQYYPMPVGHEIYFVSDKSDGVLNLYRYDLNTKASKKLTEFTGEDIKWANTDGKTVVFLEDGYLWAYDIASGDYHTLSPAVHADALLSRPHIYKATARISGLALSPSGARVAIEARGDLFSVPAKAGDTRIMAGKSGVRIQSPQWSPDGASVSFLSDESGETEIYTMPQLGGPPTQVTNLRKTILGYTWSPDWKLIAVSTVDNDLYVVDVATKSATLVTHSLYGLGGADWSPDSKWYAFIDGRVTSTAVLKLYNIDTKHTTDVTTGAYQDTDTAFDLNGKYLYLLSTRTFNPTQGIFGPDLKIENAQRIYVLTLARDTADPLTPKDDEEPTKEAGGSKPPTKPGAETPGKAKAVKIDLDGLGRRIVPLPISPSSYKNLIGAENGVYYQEAGSLVKFDLESKTQKPVLSGAFSTVAFNPDRTKLAYFGAGAVGIVSAEAPSTTAQGRVDTSGVEFMVNPRDEWREIYWDAWRFIRDHYYDENFRGMNWKAIGDHYATFLSSCASRSDLNTIISLLLSELGTSHSYLLGQGDLGPPPTPVPVGALGADYEVVNHAVKFAKIYRGESEIEADAGPLGMPGVDVNEGDYLLAIDGVKVSDQVDPSSLLLDKVGKFVTLTVNSTPSEIGARKVRVKPIASEVQLRYVEFLHRSKALVDKLSGGRIGYMHLRDTELNGMEDFSRSFNALTDKDALVVDERWNGGGYTDPRFVASLADKNYAYGMFRNGGDAPITPTILGPMALLINHYAGSGGDLFPWTFRKAGLGPLIGTRTWGGLVGYAAISDFVDGGSISTPGFAVYDPQTNEIIAENHGIEPDIEVDLRPNLAAKGEDPQLEAAVKYLMDKLAKLPARKPRERVPQVGQHGRIGG